ncbi:DUF159-domain-containing protein [Lactarius hengduanensis]|nr:DUF159-domain-containing protein [Lactarius hengduanensis]
MCGRFALALRADEIEQLDGYPALRIDRWIDRDHFVPRYNIAPRTRAPVIRRAQPGEPALVMHSMKWGLVPHWSKAEPPSLNTINARAENLEEGGGMWGSIKGRKRCVVVAQGYYEWLKKGTQRIPHFTRHKDRRLMLFAGLYDSATLDGQSEPLWTFTIVTTAASSDFAWLHDRQPVILTTQDALDSWLDTSTQTWDPKLSRLLDHSDSPLECYAVPQEKRKDGIEALFTRQAVGGKRKREPAVSHLKTERPITPELIDVDDTADAADSDVEILPGRPSESQPNMPREKPQGLHPAQSSPAPKRKLKPGTSPSPRKKSKPAESTPKITSFFSKT